METLSSETESIQSIDFEKYNNIKTVIFNNNIVIPINELKIVSGNRKTFIDLLVEKKLQEKYGNTCLKEGYIFKDSIKLIERSLGTIDPEYFTGFLRFQVRFQADVCYPIKGQKILCTVESTNKLGIKAIQEPLHIILAKQHHPDKSEFDKIKIGDKILISVLGSRFSLYDKQIDVIGLLNRYVGIDTKETVQQQEKQQQEVEENFDEVF